MAMFLTDYIIPGLVGSGIAISLLYFLSKKLLNQLLQKELIKYKSELEEKTTFLKTKLSIYAEEQNIANERIDSQKSKAIHEVYGEMFKTMHELSKLIAGSPHVTDDLNKHIDFYTTHSEQAHQYSKDLADTIVKNAIYFEETVYGKMATLSQESMMAAAYFLRPIRQTPPQARLEPEMFATIEVEQHKISKISEEVLQPLYYELISILRSKLGIEKNNVTRQ